ncbi:G-protein beta WD-40 repeats containing protein, partial [Reticulomyxa filosa]
MTTINNEKQTSTQLSLVSVRSFRKTSEEEKIQIIVQHWIRILNIKLGWIHDFDKLLSIMLCCLFICFSLYATTILMFEIFYPLSKLLKTLNVHTNIVWSIDNSTLDNSQFICSGSRDNTVRVWDLENNKQIQSFNGHSGDIYCVKFSPYHNHYRSVICSSSLDRTIRFWDFKHNQQLQVFNGHTGYVAGIEFSSFSSGRYLCSGSDDKT